LDKIKKQGNKKTTADQNKNFKNILSAVNKNRSLSMTGIWHTAYN